LRRARSLRPLALGLLLAAAAPGWAQEQAPAAAPTPAPSEQAKPVEPVPLPQVVEQGEVAERAARRLGSLAEPVPEVQHIEATLPEQSAHLQERAKRVKSLATDPTSLIVLDEELKSWELAREQLSASLTLLTGRLTDLESALEDLSQQREVWKATEEAARQAVAPDTVVERIHDVRQTLRDAKRSVEGRRDELLGLQAQVAEEEQRAHAALDALTQARSSFRSLLFLRDSAPFWTAAPERHADVTPALTETLGARWRALVHFAEIRKERLLTHLLFLVGALAGTFILRRRASAWRADDPRLEASSVIFERPVSAALLLVVSLTPLIHPRAPRLADALTIVLLVIPTLRLLPRLLEPALAPAVYALSIFAVLDSFRDVVAKAAFFERSLLLLETVAALGFLYWMLRPARLAALPAGTHIPRALGRTLQLALAALTLSAIANLAGWLHLSRLLAEGVLGSAYVAVVLYGAVRVLRTALRAGLRSEAARRFGLVRRHGADLNRWLRGAIHAVAVSAWAYFTLTAFGVEEWFLEGARRLFAAEAQFGTLGISLGDVLAFVLTLAGAFLLSRLLRTILEDDVLPRLPTARGVPHAVTTTAHYAVLLLGFLLAISAAGVDLNRVSLLAGAFGVGIGFGLQNVVNNFVSGLILLYERPVQLGDMVEVSGVTGEVARIGIRSSTIRTPQGAEVIVPNSSLISDRVVNWTFSDRRRRIEIKVGVAYGTDPERVLALLESVARGHPDVLTEPGLQALFTGFGESSLDFELRAWTALFETYVVTQSQLAVAIHRALVEAGIEIPFPQRDLHLRSAAGDAVRALRDVQG
jgi:small-conductance mechanosensitive channel